MNEKVEKFFFQPGNKKVTDCADLEVLCTRDFSLQVVLFITPLGKIASRKIAPSPGG